MGKKTCQKKYSPVIHASKKKMAFLHRGAKKWWNRDEVKREGKIGVRSNVTVAAIGCRLKRH